MIKEKQTLTKCCGVCYNQSDIDHIVRFCLSYGFKYYYIKHLPDEEENKEHYHFIIQSDSNHRFIIKSLLNDNFTCNLFQPLKSVNAYLRYMTHCDYVQKNQYDVELICSNITTLEIYSMIEEANPRNPTKEDKKKYEWYSIIFAIDSNNFTTISEVVKYCLDNDINYDLKWTYTLKTLMNERSIHIKSDKNYKIFND